MEAANRKKVLIFLLVFCSSFHYLNTKSSFNPSVSLSVSSTSDQIELGKIPSWELWKNKNKILINTLLKR